MRYTCIRGAAGTGKTRMARELVRELADRGVLVLEAECEVSSGQSAPYSSMATILEKIGHDLGTHSGEEAAEGIFNDLFGIVESVIPMGALVSGAMPKSKDQSPPLPREIAASLLTHFRKWTDDDSKVSSVLLLIDNGEKFDMASKEVLEGMVELAENETQPPPFVVLECTREMKSDHEEMPWFSSYEPQVQAEAFLTGTLGIDETLANEASRRCGESKLAPALLINWVESAINSKFFEDSEPPFGKNQAMGGKFPPPPESVYSSMTRILGEQAKEVMTSLEQAACIGLKFDLRILCETRERSKGAILDHLEHAEGMGLVQDVPETDEAFRFTSPIIVECLERRLKFPDREAWRQRAIETHKKLTDFYSQDLENNLFLAAKHACLSGTSYLEKAVKLTVDAASESFRLNAFREAADFASEALRLLKPSEAIDSKHKWVAHRVRLLAIKVLGTSPDHRDQLNRLFNELSTDPNGSEEKVSLLGTLAISLAQTDQFEASENCIRLAKSSASTDICVIEIAHAQAFALKSQHKCKEAIEALNEVIDDAKIQGGTVELKQAMAKALDIRANAKQTRGDDRISKEDRASSINDIEESLKIKREICDKYGQALSLGGLGRYYLYSPDVDFDKHAKEAIEAFEQNLRISEEIGNLVGQLKMPGLIAGCHRRSKNYEQAIEAYGDAVEVATRHHSDMDLAFALSGLASCLHETGQVEKRDESGTELAQVLGKMEPQTAAHLSHELDWLKGIDEDVEWAKEIKLLKESL